MLQIFEKKPTATKNYGIWIRYQSRSGFHNMYKEFRDLTLNGAVEQMYTEMASRHRVRSHQMHIIKTTVVKAADCKRVNITQFHDSQIKFPVLRKCDFSSHVARGTFTLLETWVAVHESSGWGPAHILSCLAIAIAHRWLLQPVLSAVVGMFFPLAFIWSGRV